MALRDEIRRERQAVAKNGTLKDKWDYFTAYYMAPTVAIIAAIGLITYFIYDTVTRPDTILNAIFLNTFNYDSTTDPIGTLDEEFTKYLEISSDEDVEFSHYLSLTGDISTDYQASQAITAQVSAETVDFIVSPRDAILEYGYGGMFVELSEVLTSAQMETYKPYFLYIDMAVYEARAAAFDNGQKASDIEIPDPTKPEAMEEPVPVFIDITGCEKVASAYNYELDSLVFGIAGNAPNPTNICKFVDYIFE